MLFLTESDVRALLPIEVAIDVLEAMFHRLASAESQNQPRRRLMLPSGSVLHYMAGADGAYFGAKIYSTNARHGAHFLFLLYSAADARPLAMMEANHLGQIRTGAASGYATKLLARPDAAILGIIGSGFQARTQLDAIRAVRPIRLVKVWSRSVERRAAFAQESGATAVDTADRAVRGCDIVVTATNAKDPVLDDAWISAGTHVNAMGSNQAQRRELPPNLIRRAALIVVDSLEQARMESGDLLLALPPEEWSTRKLIELKDLKGHPSPDAVTIFKSNGIAVEDVASAAYVYERAVREGRGEKLKIYS